MVSKWRRSSEERERGRELKRAIYVSWACSGGRKKKRERYARGGVLRRVGYLGELGRKVKEIEWARRKEKNA